MISAGFFWNRYAEKSATQPMRDCVTEMALFFNNISHWLDASLESALYSLN